MPEDIASGHGYSITPGQGHEAAAAGKKRRPGTKPQRPSVDEQSDAPQIHVVPGDLPQAVDAAEQALIGAERPVFTRGGTLVRPIIETIGAADDSETLTAKLKTYCVDSLSDVLARVAVFSQWNERRRGWKKIDPPPKVASTLLAREGEWKLPAVSGIITTPTLRPDGSLLSEPGYDRATRLYLSPDPAFRLAPMPDRPTRRDAEIALRMLAELISGFPFVEAVDRAVALSGILTAILRPILPAAPLHAFRASTPGTGKTYLVDVFSAIATGRRCPVISAGKTEEEAEKRLSAMLLEAVPIISVDNVNGELGGVFLCQVAERPIVKVRPLGQSSMIEIEVRSAIYATGNNLTLVGDMTRRTVLATLDAGMERPELREFAFKPVERVLSDRGAYVAAALTVLRAYRIAGSPDRLKPLASYEIWSDTVRSALVWLGEADPTASMETVREEDPELAAIRELFAHWESCLGLDSGYTSAAVIQSACSSAPTYGSEDTGFQHPEFRDVLLRQAGERGAVNTKRLGKWLSRISGRIVDGHRLVMKIDASNGNRYSLQPVQNRSRGVAEGAEHALQA